MPPSGALCRFQAIGVLSSAYTSGWLIARVGARPVLGLMALFPLLMCFTAGLIREQRQPDLTRAQDPSLDGAGGPDHVLLTVGQLAFNGTQLDVLHSGAVRASYRPFLRFYTPAVALHQQQRLHHHIWRH